MLPDKAARPPGRLPGNVDCALPLDVPVPDLLTANYTFVNERLAKHHGIPNIYGSHFRRITLPPTARGADCLVRGEFWR